MRSGALTTADGGKRSSETTNFYSIFPGATPGASSKPLPISGGCGKLNLAPRITNVPVRPLDSLIPAGKSDAVGVGNQYSVSSSVLAPRPGPDGRYDGRRTIAGGSYSGLG
ncbi:unnamed protein product [Peronospora belbahrii]|uniref:Uncharacterized protein n=1 Tax=Peronospora belbahrii TaxID=622444 RepID=A0ABN8DE10_9STRA|nr:unnamed protein product [Peronospora belbahrii]